MAKKKTAETANIKAAPVLRSSGDDPTPVTPVITKSYSVRDDWKDKNKVNYVAFKSVDGEVQDLTVNGEPAGGGGGGDLGTAEVTFNVSVEEYPEWYGCTIQEAMPPIFPNDCSTGTIRGSSGTVTVITYKGYAQLRPLSTSGISISVTGSAQLGDFGMVYVTGPCTITVQPDGGDI